MGWVVHLIPFPLEILSLVDNNDFPRQTKNVGWNKELLDMRVREDQIAFSINSEPKVSGVGLSMFSLMTLPV